MWFTILVYLAQTNIWENRYKNSLLIDFLTEMECEISQFGAGNSKTMHILLSNHPSAWNFNAENWYLAQIEHTQPTKVLQSSLSTRTYLINVQKTCQNKRQCGQISLVKYSNLYNKRAEDNSKLAVRFCLFWKYTY